MHPGVFQPEALDDRGGPAAAKRWEHCMEVWQQRPLQHSLSQPEEGHQRGRLSDEDRGPPEQ